MSERAERNPGTKVAFPMDFDARYPVLRGGMGADFHRGVATGGPRVGSGPGGGSNRGSGHRGGGFFHRGSDQSPEWYRRLALGASAFSTVAVAVIIATRGGLHL